MANLIYDGLYQQNNLNFEWGLNNLFPSTTGEKATSFLKTLDVNANGFVFGASTLYGNTPNFVLNYRNGTNPDIEIFNFDTTANIFTFDYPVKVPDPSSSLRGLTSTFSYVATTNYVDGKVGSLDLSSIPCSGNVSLNGHKLTNVTTPSATTDGANKSYVDGKTWTASQISDFSTAVPAFRLDQFAVPTFSVNFNSQKITNLLTPTLSTDAANKSYVDGKTWVSTQITDFATAVEAFRLDQLAVPISALNMNSQKITGVAVPSLSSDVVNLTYLQSYVFNINTATTGSLAINRLANYPSSSSQFLRGDGSWAVPSGAGNVTGPSSSTDKALVTFNGTSGTLIQNNTPTISASGVIQNLADGSLTSDAATLNNVSSLIASKKTQNIQTITSGTSWSVPSGVSIVKATLIAGGGGGGAGTSGPNSGGGGGGGGSLTVYLNVSSVSSLAITIGAQGTGGTSGGAGTSGGNTTLILGSYTFTTTGGAGGVAGVSAGAAGGLGGTASVSGGTYSPGYLGIRGGDGGWAMDQTYTKMTGQGGDAFNFKGAMGIFNKTTAAGAAAYSTSYGTGGSGGVGSSQPGGNGCQGCIIFEW